MKLGKQLLGISAALAAALAAHGAPAPDDYHWTNGGVGTSWATAGNWLENDVPNNNHNVFFDHSAAFNVTNVGTKSYGTVNFASGTNTGNVVTLNGTTLTAKDGIFHDGGSTILNLGIDLQPPGAGRAIHVSDDTSLAGGAPSGSLQINGNVDLKLRGPGGNETAIAVDARSEDNDRSLTIGGITTIDVDGRGIELAATAGHFEGGGGDVSLTFNGEVNLKTATDNFVINPVVREAAVGTAVINFNGPLTGGSADVEKMVISIGGDNNSGAGSQVNFNHSDNTIQAWAMTIGGDWVEESSSTGQNVFLRDSAPGSTPTANNIPNVQNIEVLAGNVLDVTGLTGNGFNLGANIPQGLYVDLADGDAYVGGLTVNPGSEAEFSGGDLSVDPGESFFNNGSLSVTAGDIVLNGGSLGGTGTFEGMDGDPIGVVVNAGTLAPGASVGTTNLGDVTWVGPFSIDLEVSDATGAAGAHPGWDLLIVDELDVSAFAGAVVNLISSADGLNPGGIAANFDPNSPYAWEFLQYDTLVGALNLGLFSVDTSSFANAIAGVFSITNVGNAIQLAYTPGGGGGGGGGGAIPEPGTWVMFALLAAGGLLYRRRRKTATA